MPEFVTALTVDQDVFDYEPSLSGSTAIVGQINTFHNAAGDDVARILRKRWWGEVLRSSNIPAQYLLPYLNNSETVPMGSLSGMLTAKLSATQLKKLAVYRVLGWYVWPMLDTHNEGETLAKKKSQEFKSRFDEELALLLENGIAYDWDGDGTAELYDEATIPNTKGCRIERA